MLNSVEHNSGVPSLRSVLLLLVLRHGRIRSAVWWCAPSAKDRVGQSPLLQLLSEALCRFLRRLMFPYAQHSIELFCPMYSRSPLLWLSATAPPMELNGYEVAALSGLSACCSSLLGEEVMSSLRCCSSSGIVLNAYHRGRYKALNGMRLKLKQVQPSRLRPRRNDFPAATSARQSDSPSRVDQISLCLRISNAVDFHQRCRAMPLSSTIYFSGWLRLNCNDRKW